MFRIPNTPQYVTYEIRRSSVSGKHENALSATYFKRAVEWARNNIKCCRYVDTRTANVFKNYKCTFSALKSSNLPHLLSLCTCLILLIKKARKTYILL